MYVKIVSIIFNDLIKIAIDDFKCFKWQSRKKFWIPVFLAFSNLLALMLFFPFQFPKTRVLKVCQNDFQKYRESFAVDSFSKVSVASPINDSA